MSQVDETRGKAPFRPTGSADLVVNNEDRSMMPTRDQLLQLLIQEINDKPFSELSGVTFDHQGAELSGHVLLDVLEDAGYSVDDFDAVGALTSAAIPLADALLHAAASRGQSLNAFVMDFVYPSIKGPSIEGKRVILLDAWLSQKSYVQTSSLVTLRRGNVLSLDWSIIQRQGAQTLAIASLIGGVGSKSIDPSQAGEKGSATETIQPGRPGNSPVAPTIQVVDSVDGSEVRLPFIYAYDEELFMPQGEGSR